MSDSSADSAEARTLSNTDVVVAAHGVYKSYGSGDQKVDVLRDLTLEVNVAQMVSIMGPSGTGKSTLLHVLSGLDSHDAGEVIINGRNIDGLSEREMATWRAKYLGFVLQQHNFVPSLTIEENVAAPLILAGVKRARALTQAREKLGYVGVAERARAWPAEASIGQLQRAAVARSCVGEPIVVFADEPTGALDQENRSVVLDLFRSITKEVGAAAVVVTHDPAVAAAGDRTVRMSGGTVEESTE